MVPPRTVIREQILAAAERVIAEFGYAGATTKAIAKAAHCSEGSLYNYFPDKRALFMECAFAQNAGLLDRLTSLPDRVGQATVDENLVELLEALLAFQRRLVPVLLTNWASGDHATGAHQHAEAAKPYAAPETHMHDAHEAMHAALPEELRGGPHRLIASYLDSERAIGRLRADLDTDAAAWLLMSIPFNAAFLDTVKPNVDMPLGQHDRITRTVAIVVDGMR
ncbi:MAG TPA: TetR/AcrR family transcriptional regulator [Acidimicrobiia bacterium]|jgi:AcrR family transcriptional regulator